MDAPGAPMNVPPGPAQPAVPPAHGGDQASVHDGITAPLPIVGADAQAAPQPPPMAPPPAPMAQQPPPMATAPAPLTPSPAPSGSQRCPSCGTDAAADQRYCVECGQRLAGARPLLMGAPSGSDSQGSPASPPGRRRFDLPPSATLIAGIATLLIAMGVGVLIGRLDNGSSSKGNTTYIPTVVSSPGAAGAATATEQSSASGSQTAKPATSSTSKAAAKTPTKEAIKPANPTVKIGQAGHGAGYQHGHFTGHFFGAENESASGEGGEESSTQESSKAKSKGSKG